MVCEDSTDDPYSITFWEKNSNVKRLLAEQSLNFTLITGAGLPQCCVKLGLFPSLKFRIENLKI